MVKEVDVLAVQCVDCAESYLALCADIEKKEWVGVCPSCHRIMRLFEITDEWIALAKEVMDLSVDSKKTSYIAFSAAQLARILKK